MAKTIKVRDGQNFWDVILRYYGNIEDAKKIVEQFNDVTDKIPVFTELTIEDTNNNIVTLFERNRIDIATYDHPLPLSLIWNNGEGIQWNTLEEVQFNNE